MYEEELIYKNVSPRTERRLLKEKASIGRSIGSISRNGKRIVPFDPDAIDADGDQFVQDGTVWQRPDVDMPNGLSSGKKAKKQRQAQRQVTKKQTTFRAYTLKDDLSEAAPDRQAEDPDAELIATSVDELFETAMHNISQEFDLSAGVDPDIAVDLVVAGLDIKIGTPESSLKQVLDKYNEKNGTNHQVLSVVLGMFDKRPDLSASAKKKILETLFPDEAERKELLDPIHKSMDYSDGDFSYGTLREINIGDPGVYLGMTPKQISKLAVPDNLYEFASNAIDMIFGPNTVEAHDLEKRWKAGDTSLSQEEINIAKTYNNLLGLIAARFVGPNGYGVKFDKKEVANLRLGVEKSLSESPLFLSIVHKFGMPPIIPMEMFIQGKHDPKTLGLTLLGHHVIGINTHMLQSKEASGLGTRKISVYDLIGNEGITSVSDVIRHEWGHYLQSLLDKALGVNYKGGGLGSDYIMENNPYVKNLLKDLDPLTRRRLMRELSIFDDMTDRAYPKDLVLEQRQLENFQAQKQFAQDIQYLYRQIWHTKDANMKKQLLANLRQQIIEAANTVYSDKIVNLTPYAATMPQELFAEIIKDFLSGNYSSREIYFNDRTKELLEFIFGLLND